MLSPGYIPIKYNLPNSFKEELRSKKVKWGYEGLSEFTFYRTYSRKKENGKLETWADCVIRVIEGMFTILKTNAEYSHIPWEVHKADKLAKEAAERMFEFKWTPPGRGLWMMGTNYMWERGSMALYNCSFVSTQNLQNELSKPFAFAMDVLMCGVGVGYDTKGANTVFVAEPEGEDELILVQDTREGWVEAISCLIDSYISEGSGPVKIDTRLVRKYGEPIKGFGGVASGPEPLVQGFEAIRSILSNRDGEYLQACDIVDIFDIIGKIVVAGNVRRSALLALGEPDDEDYLNLKNYETASVEMGLTCPTEVKELSEEDYNLYNNDFNARKEIAEKYNDYPWAFKFGGFRWASNNSVYGKPGMDYSRIAELISSNGEPGIFWLENAKNYGRMIDGPKFDDTKVLGVNPCSEIQLESYEVCNLNENYPAKHDDYWDFQRTLKFSYLYSKTITLMGTHWMETNSIVNRNRRIGCSISGIQELFVKAGRAESLNWMDQAYNYINYIDKKYSDWLGIPLSIRKTAIKPSGTVSILAGSLPGIHHPESTSYYRTIRVSSDSELVEILKNANYRIEPAASDPKKTVVVYFPVLHDEDHIDKSKVSIWRQFKDTSDVQKYYADNMVSVTVTFNKQESSEIADCLTAFESELKSVSLLPLSEHGYQQAPYIAADRQEIIDYKNSLSIIDFSVLSEEDEMATEMNKFCEGDSCQLF